MDSDLDEMIENKKLFLPKFILVREMQQQPPCITFIT